MSLPGYSYQYAFKYTDNKLQTLQDEYLVLLLENNIRGGISSVMGDRYVVSDDNKKLLYVDATNLYGHSRSQMLLYKEAEMWYGHRGLHKNNLEGIINKADDSDIGCFVEVDIKYPGETKEITKNLPFVPEIKKYISS